jgi:hypothetical protein
LIFNDQGIAYYFEFKSDLSSGSILFKTQAPLSSPKNIAMISTDTFYINSYNQNHQIVKINLQTQRFNVIKEQKNNGNYTDLIVNDDNIITLSKGSD